mgnify:FL=1
MGDGMAPEWVGLAAAMLDTAADSFANHGCNDWQWPADWSRAKRRRLAVAMVADNVGRPPAQFTAADRAEVDDLCRGAHGPPDWWVMRFLAGRLAGRRPHEGEG